MNFKPCFSELKQSDKDILYIVHPYENTTIILRDCYNSIGDSYMGIQIEAFIENIRGLLRTYPNFLEVVDLQPRRELKELGFVQVEPTELEVMLYKK